MTKTVEQIVKVTATDPIEFAKLLLDLGKKGARIKYGSYVFLRNYPLSCEVVVDVTPDTQLESEPNLLAIPIAKPLTEEELEALAYDEILKVAEENAGIKAKKKVDIVKEYLKLYPRVSPDKVE